VRRLRRGRWHPQVQTTLAHPEHDAGAGRRPRRQRLNAAIMSVLFVLIGAKLIGDAVSAI
jgi:hypothetical protein